MSVDWDSMYPDSDVDHYDQLAGKCDCNHNLSDHTDESDKCTKCKCKKFTTEKWKGYGKTHGPSALKYEEDQYETWKKENLKKIKLGGVDFLLLEKETPQTFRKHTRISYVIELQTRGGGYDRIYSGKSPTIIVNKLKKRRGIRKDSRYRIKKCIVEITESVILEKLEKKIDLKR